jgi:UDP-N-acetylglucosamine 2-epimerase (non-hydrolysing)
MRAEESIRLVVINSGQHGVMLDHIMKVLEIQPDVSLSIMSHGQDLAMLMSKGISAANEVLGQIAPEILVVHGDTTTAASFATAAFTRKIDVHHVEAGLRTHNLLAPFPEEFNRQLIARVARANYAPTSLAKNNLIAENVPSHSIFVTGNTAVDSTAWAAAKLQSKSSFRDQATEELAELGLLELFSSESSIALVTLHRRENAGDNFYEVLTAIESAASSRPNFHFVFPVHPNPIIANPASKMFASVENVHLCRPMNFAAFSLLLTTCEFVISDSGGIQEEAVSLSKRVILARNGTERPEGLSTGFVNKPELSRVGLSKVIMEHIDAKRIGGCLNLESNPFGDGKASQRITQHLVSNSFAEEFVFA